MMRRIFALGAMAIALMSAGGVAAQDHPPVVVELFTSQGCSSCPPADAILRKLAKHEGVIPLALHIDYWDYIGWKDQFAHPSFTKRQKAYAQAGGHNVIYTPQMIVNGADDVVGNKAMDVADMIQRHRMRPSVVEVSLSASDGSINITAEALQALGPVEVHLVRYIPEKAASITRGENAGLMATYSHIVTDWDTIDSWNGSGTWSRQIARDDTAPVVVVIQAEGHGEIYGAARLK